MLCEKLLEKNSRISKRKIDEQREVSFEHFDGLVIVRSPTSVIYLGYSKTIVAPYPDKPAEGIIQFNFERGKKNDLLLNFLNTVYIKSKCIPLKELCLKYSQQVEALTIEIFPIEPDGDLKLLTVAGINEIFKKIGLRTHFNPIFKSYGFANDKILSDPDATENTISNWNAIGALRSPKEIIFFEKTGEGVPISDICTIIDKMTNN